MLQATDMWPATLIMATVVWSCSSCSLLSPQKGQNAVLFSQSNFPSCALFLTPGAPYSLYHLCLHHVSLGKSSYSPSQSLELRQDRKADLEKKKNVLTLMFSLYFLLA